MGGGAPLKIDGQLSQASASAAARSIRTSQSSEAGLLEPPASEAIKMNIEVIVLPVADADRAKRFYGDLGWRPTSTTRATITA